MMFFCWMCRARQ